MTYLTALGSVLAIIAIIIVAGAIIYFIAKTIINVFDAEKKVDDKDQIEEVNSIRENVYKNEKISYMTPEVTSTTTIDKKEVEVDEDFSYALDVNNDIAKKEEEELKKEAASKVDDDFFKDFKKESNEKFSYKDIEEDDEEEFDLMSMVDEISDDVLDDKKIEIDERARKESAETASILDKYSLDSFMNDDEDEEIDTIEEDVEIFEEPVKAEPVKNDNVEEIKSIRDEIYAMLQDLRNSKTEDEEAFTEETIEEKVEEKIDENLAVIEELRRALEQKELELSEMKDSKAELESKYAEINRTIVEEFNSKNREIENHIHNTINASREEIESLKSQLEQVSKQLEEERGEKWKVANTGAGEVVERPIKVVESNIVEEEIEEVEEDDNEGDEGFEISEVKRIADEEIEAKVQERLTESTKIIEELTKRVEELTTTTVKTEVAETVHFQFSTEAQYLARIEVLEERLRIAKKDLKDNDKEYKPLAKVKKTLERDKAKLRRKDAIVAKKKIDLYGVNNYVDLDKEKAEKLAHELELFDGLKFSVIHCEEVMNANRERYPILERTHNILTNNIADIEADLAELHKELKALKDKKDND